MRNMQIYLGHCSSGYGDEDLLDIWKTEWKAKRAIIAKLFKDIEIQSEYHYEEGNTDDLGEHDYVATKFSKINYDTSGKISAYCVKNCLNKALFLKCTDIELIDEMWDNIYEAQKEWGGNFDGNLFLHCTDIEVINEMWEALDFDYFYYKDMNWEIKVKNI